MPELATYKNDYTELRTILEALGHNFQMPADESLKKYLEWCRKK